MQCFARVLSLGSALFCPGWSLAPTSVRMEEVPHEPHVRLMGFGATRPMVLYHCGTDERVAVEGQWQLNFASGFAYLSPAGDPDDDSGESMSAQWVKELFTTALVRTVGQAQPFVIDPSTGERQELVAHVRAEPFKNVGSTTTFAAELYIHILPQRFDEAPGLMTVFWALPWPLDCMTKGVVVPNNRWSTRFVAQSLPVWLESCGFRDGSAHCRKSKKALTDKHRRSGVPMPASLLASPEEEHSVSTLALLVWVSVWAAGQHMKGWQAGQSAQISAKAFALLANLVELCIDDGEYEMRVGEQMITIVDRRVDRDEVRRGFPLLARRLSPGEFGSSIAFPDLLRMLVRAQTEREQRPTLAACAADLLRTCICFLTSAHELTRRDVGLQQGDAALYLSMPVLRGRSGKVRRVPARRKISMVDAVAEDVVLKDASQLVAAENLLKRKAGEVDCDMSVSPKTAKRYKATHVYSYFLQGCQDFRKTRHLGVALDGVRAGGMKLLISAAYSCTLRCGMWLAPQALRDTKYKRTSAGYDFSDLEAQSWQAKVAAFFASESDGLSTARQRQSLAKELNRPRQASLDFIKAFQHQLSAHFGEGLERYASCDLVLEATVENGVLLFPESSGGKTSSLPPFLSVVADQASDQCCAFSFLKYKQMLMFEMLPDHSHLSNNATLNAMVRAGLQGVVRVSIAIYNMKYGAGNRGQFVREYEEASADMARNLTPDDALIAFMWPRVCADKGWADSESTSTEACSSWLRQLPLSKAAREKGPQAGTSRWFSYIHASWFWDASWNELLAIGIFLSVTSGWASSWSDIFSVERTTVETHLASVAKEASEMVSRVAPAEGGAGVAGSCSSGEGASATSSSSSSRPEVSASSSSGPAAAPAAGSSEVGAGVADAAAPRVSRAAQEAAGKAEIAALKQCSKNSLHAVLRLLGRDDIRYQCRMVGLAAGPFAMAHAEQQRVVKGEAASRAQMASWAHGSWLDACKKCIMTCSNFGALERCGILPQPLSKPSVGSDARRNHEAELHTQDAMFEQYWRLVLSLIREHGASNCHYSCSFPCLIAGVFHDDPEKVAESLRLWQEHADAYDKARSYPWPSVTRLLKKHPLQGTAMQLGLRIMRLSEWSLSHIQAKEFLDALFGGFMSTVIIEQSAQVLRDAETRSAVHKNMQLTNVYERLIQSKLLDNHDRHDLKVAMSVNPPADFEKTYHPIQLAAEKSSTQPTQKLDFDMILGQQDWPTYSAQSQRHVYAQLAALRELHRRDLWARASDLWHVRLVPEGAFVFIQERQLHALVIAVMDEAALVWPLERVAVNMYKLQVEIKALEWLCVFAADEVQARPVENITP